MGWFDKLTGALASRNAAPVKTHYGNSDPLQAPPPSSKPAREKVQLAWNMGFRDATANEVEAVLLAHPAVVDAAVGRLDDGNRSRFCAVILVKSHTTLLTDLQNHCAQHPQIGKWFSHFSISKLEALDGPGPLADDDRALFEEYLELEANIPTALVKAAGYDGKSRDPADIRRLLDRPEFANLLEVGKRYRRLRGAMGMVADALPFLSPETRASLPPLNKHDYACLDAFEATGKVPTWTSEAFLTIPLQEEAEQRQRVEAEYKRFQVEIDKAERLFSDIHSRLNFSVETFDKTAPEITFTPVVGQLKPKEILLIQYAQIAALTGLVDRENYYLILKTAFASYPWTFTKEWNAVSPSSMEAKAGFISLINKHIKKYSVDEIYVDIANASHKIQEKDPNHPLVAWFQRCSRGGAGGGWATSR